jgi:hypothetical protein
MLQYRSGTGRTSPRTTLPHQHSCPYSRPARQKPSTSQASRHFSMVAQLESQLVAWWSSARMLCFVSLFITIIFGGSRISHLTFVSLGRGGCVEVDLRPAGTFDDRPSASRRCDFVTSAVKVGLGLIGRRAQVGLMRGDAKVGVLMDREGKCEGPQSRAHSK